MITGISLIVAMIIIALVFFYKREMIYRVTLKDISGSTKEFQNELEHTADHVIKRMELHIAQLEYLISEADEKIARLDKQLEAAERRINSANTAATFSASSLSENSENDAYDQPEDSLLTEDSEAAAQGPVREAAGGNEQPPAAEGQAGESNKQAVLAMAEQGYDVTEIAKATGMGRGAIMLLIQLHKK